MSARSKFNPFWQTFFGKKETKSKPLSDHKTLARNFAFVIVEKRGQLRNLFNLVYDTVYDWIKMCDLQYLNNQYPKITEILLHDCFFPFYITECENFMMPNMDSICDYLKFIFVPEKGAHPFEVVLLPESKLSWVLSDSKRVENDIGELAKRAGETKFGKECKIWSQRPLWPNLLKYPMDVDFVIVPPEV